MKFTVYRDGAGDWRWRLVAANGNTLADSGEGYRRRFACVRSLRRIIDRIEREQFSIEGQA